MHKHKHLPKVIVILGATASGKTATSLKLAKEINGEIVSADSRQIYKKMDIGTAKEKGEWRRNGLSMTYFVDDIPHHLIDFLDPGKTFTAAQFRDNALKYIKLASKHGRVPIIVGGTGLYIQALVDNYQIPRVEANKKLRKSFEEKTKEELLTLLESLDPNAAKTIDKNNKRRLIRAVEVCILTGKPFSEQQIKGEPLVNALQIGLDVERDVLIERIHKRVDQMMEEGLEKEVRSLVHKGYPWRLPSMSGVGYRQFKEYFDGSKSLEETIERLKRDTRQYARRQRTWFRRDKRIHWLKEYCEIKDLVQDFLAS